MQFEPANIKRLIEDRQYETAIELCNEKLSEATATEIDQTVRASVFGYGFLFFWKTFQKHRVLQENIGAEPQAHRRCHFIERNL